MSQLVCVGSVVVDVALEVPALPSQGGDVVARSGTMTVGGAYNLMTAARRQGVPTVYAGGHGTGPLGAMVRSALEAAGIEITSPPLAGTDTGFCIVMIEPGGERTFATVPGAEAILDRAHLDSIPVYPDDIVYVSGYGLTYPGSSAALREWIGGLDDGVTVVVDPGPLVSDIARDVLASVASRCDWWSCNQREALLMTGAPEPSAAIVRLAEETGREGVIVRLGADGCLLQLRGAEVEQIPARLVNVVDSTGAGDAHVGTFIASLAVGRTPLEAARRANVAAGIAVSRLGPATAPTAQELDEACANFDLRQSS